MIPIIASTENLKAFREVHRVRVTVAHPLLATPIASARDFV